jgi:alkanesulfonate monooxygenase SsuD/methylene tetrahydromethanopterin reductase-like flavin-dependent oxidoreductase (luciferase family)
MSSSRQLRLGAFMRPVSIHTAAWRYPDAYPDANLNFKHLTRFAQTLERGKFDAFFMADHLAVLNMPVQALKRSATVSRPRRRHTTSRITSRGNSRRSITSAAAAPDGMW